MFFKSFQKSASRTLLFLFILVCHTALFGTERYGAIEIGGKGVKGYVVEIDHDLASIHYRTSLNSAPQSGIDSHNLMNKEMIHRVSNDAIVLKKTLLSDQNISEQNIYIIASSAINKIINKSELEKSIKATTRLTLYFIDEKEESIYAFYGSIPKSQWNSSSMMDIGGGNTKVAWINPKNAIDFFEIPLGTVSLSNQADQRDQNATFEEKCTTITHENISYLKKSEDKETLYTNGGIFWATAYLKTDGQLESYVSLEKEDFERVITLFSKEQITCIDDKTARCFLRQHYGAKNLIAGAVLAKTVLDQLNYFTQKIYFAKDGAWVNGWLLMRSKNLK